MEKLFKEGKRISFYCIAVFLLSSCATILNGKRTTVKLSADRESRVLYNNDTIRINKTRTSIYPLRSKKTIKLTVLQDSLQGDFYLNRKISNLFWANIFNPINLYAGVIGLGTDLTNKKRFTYKRNLHFTKDTVNNKIVLSNKKVISIPKKQLFIYNDPLRLIDVLSIPMATLGVEYFVKNNISLSTEYGLSGNQPSFRNLTSEDEILIREKGRMYRLESKLYNTFNLTKNVHLNEYVSFEFRNIKSQFNDVIEYVDKGSFDNLSDNEIYDVEATRDVFATKKNVSIVNVKYGILVPVGKRFYFDFYSGLGIRMKRLKDINKEFDPNIHEIFEEDDLFSFNPFDFNQEGNSLNISLGFKIGYQF
jgi:hypothetical protein